MIKNRPYLFREFFVTQSNHWFYFAAILVYFSIQIASPSFLDLLCWGILGFFPFLLCVIRDHTDRYILLFLFSILPALGILLFPLSADAPRSLYMAFAMLYVFLSIYHSAKEKSHLTRIIPLYGSLPVLFLLAFIQSFSEYELSFFPYCISAILVSGCYFLAYYADKFLYFTLLNEGTAASMPEDKIFRSGAGISCIYVLVGSVICYFLALFAVPDQFYRSFRLWIREKLRHFLALIGSMFTIGETGDLTTEAFDKLPAGNPEQFESSSSFFWRLLEVLSIAVMSFAAAALVLGILIKLMMFLFRVRREETEAEEEPNELPDLHEKLKPQKQRYFVAGTETDLSIQRRIRRLFRRKLKLSIEDFKVLRTTTAREFAAEEKNSLLADIYEKARYSEIPCTEQDLKEMQIACRRKQHVD